MPRTKPAGALLGALLVVVSGAAVGLAAAAHGPAPSAVSPAQLPAQENATMQNATANVTFLNQTSDGTTVLVNGTFLPEGGFVAIHLSERRSPGNFSVGPVIGNSSFLEAGVSENVTVTLDRTINESQWLVAMPHRDTNDNQVYEFPDGDDPYFADGSIPVTDPAFVEVSPGAELEVTEEVAEGNVTVGNETATNETAEEAMGNETAGNESASVGGSDY